MAVIVTIMALPEIGTVALEVVVLPPSDSDAKVGMPWTKKYGVVKEERGIRTLFVQNLPLNITERRVEDWFEERDCEVRDVQLVFDKMRKFKGLAYVELYQKESVPIALKLNGVTFDGKAIVIESANATKNEVSAPIEGPTEVVPGAPEPLLRLYLGNLDYGITQADVVTLLQQFGPVESVRLQVEPSGKSKGHAFIQFYHRERALAAFYKLNNTFLAGRQLRCDFTKDARSKDFDLPASPPMTNTRTVYYPESGNAGNGASDHAVPAMKPSAEVGSLDDELNGSSSSMHSLIQRLAASTTTSTSASITSANISAPQPQIPLQHNNGGQMLVTNFDKSSLPSPGVPSNCFVLRNVFDPSTEESPNFDEEIREDMAPEASKHGKLTHIFVDKHSFGDVYMRFETVEMAQSAVESFHGRFFAYRVIRAEYLSPAVYHQKFDL